MAGIGKTRATSGTPAFDGVSARSTGWRRRWALERVAQYALGSHFCQPIGPMLRRLALLAAITLAGCSSMPPDQAAMGSAREVFAAYVDAFNAQKWDRVVALYSDQPGFQWIENGNVIYTSKRDVADAYAWLREHVRRASYLPSDTNITGLNGSTAQISTRFVTRVEICAVLPFNPVMLVSDGW